MDGMWTQLWLEVYVCLGTKSLKITAFDSSNKQRHTHTVTQAADIKHISSAFEPQDGARGLIKTSHAATQSLHYPSCHDTAAREQQRNIKKAHKQTQRWHEQWQLESIWQQTGEQWGRVSPRPGLCWGRVRLKEEGGVRKKGGAEMQRLTCDNKYYEWEVWEEHSKQFRLHLVRLFYIPFFSDLLCLMTKRFVW